MKLEVRSPSLPLTPSSSLTPSFPSSRHRNHPLPSPKHRSADNMPPLLTRIHGVYALPATHFYRDDALSRFLDLFPAESAVWFLQPTNTNAEECRVLRRRCIFHVRAPLGRDCSRGPIRVDELVIRPPSPIWVGHTAIDLPSLRPAPLPPLPTPTPPTTRRDLPAPVENRYIPHNLARARSPRSPAPRRWTGPGEIEYGDESPWGSGWYGCCREGWAESCYCGPRCPPFDCCRAIRVGIRIVEHCWRTCTPRRRERER